MDRKEAAIQLKLVRAKSLLREVPVLLEQQFHHTAVNRLCYACFHITKALLLTKDPYARLPEGIE
jgi:uncharacterized protein (UPF0332 family)